MEKGIDKSAQRALEAYPVEMYEEVGWRCVDKNTYKRQYFIEGYHQAEKDLEFGWEDIKLIDSLIDDVSLEETDTIEDLYQEVLKRFKERKEK